MLTAGQAASRFVAGRSSAELRSDEMLRRALINAIQEIGEAAARVTDEGRARVPELPWGQVVGMRHILVHVYWGVDLDQVWKVATQDIPTMVSQIDAAFTTWPPVADG